jgi:hypothetical protein
MRKQKDCTFMIGELQFCTQGSLYTVYFEAVRSANEECFYPLRNTINIYLRKQVECLHKNIKLVLK